MKNSEKSLTSVYVNPNHHEQFQINGIKNKVSFNRLVECAMYFYNTDPEFRKKVTNTIIPETYSSK